MFRKLVSNLPFSPGLVGQVGFYVKRLRKEEFIRRVGMIFTALSLAIQTMSLVSPPTYAQANHDNNVVYEAVSSKSHFLDVWDNGDNAGNKDVDDLMLYYGITKNNVKDASLVSLSSTEKFNGYETYSFGRKAYGKPGEFKLVLDTNEGDTSVFYGRKWAASWGSYTTQALKGKTDDGRTFAVLMNCGNLVIAIQDPVVKKPVKGSFNVTCEAVKGWAYDPRLESVAVKVKINVDGNHVKTLTANQATPKAPVSGNHGFSWNVPDLYADGSSHKFVVTVIEDVAARGISEGNKNLGAKYLGEECAPPPVEIEVCDTRTWTWVTILETERKDYHKDLTYAECQPPEEKVPYCNILTGELEMHKPSEADDKYYLVDEEECDPVPVCREGEGIINVKKYELDDPKNHTDLSMCEDVTVCVDDELITIKRYDYTGQETQCPVVQVCRDGVVIPIHTNEILDTDLDPEDCDELTVCDADGVIVTILRKDYDEDTHSEPFRDSYGQLTCEEPAPEFSEHKRAINVTQGIDDANGTTAKPGDVITYELNTVNSGDLNGKYDVVEDIGDILEYATLEDDGGANYDEEAKILTWKEIAIGAGEDVTHTFTVKVMDELPTTATSQAAPSSYDFVLTNFYGNAVEIKLPKPVSKTVEEFATTIPNTGPAENAMFMTLFVALVAFFYFRNRLITKELTLIRAEYNGV